MLRKTFLILISLSLVGAWKVWSNTMSDPEIMRRTVTTDH